MCKEFGCTNKVFYREMCRKHFVPLPKTECLMEDCSVLNRSSTGYCRKHKAQGDWSKDKQAKAEWFARQPEDNITDAVIRYALNNDLHLKLFTNTKTEGDCLVWKGANNGKYGMIGVRVRVGKGQYFSHPVLTHRLAFASKDDLPSSQLGPRNDTLVVNHICRNTVCVNPSHLEVITQKENWEYAHRQEQVA